MVVTVPVSIRWSPDQIAAYEFAIEADLQALSNRLLDMVEKLPTVPLGPEKEAPFWAYGPLRAIDAENVRYGTERFDAAYAIVASLVQPTVRQSEDAIFIGLARLSTVRVLVKVIVKKGRHWSTAGHLIQCFEICYPGVLEQLKRRIRWEERSLVEEAEDSQRNEDSLALPDELETALRGLLDQPETVRIQDVTVKSIAKEMYMTANRLSHRYPGVLGKRLKQRALELRPDLE